MNVTANRSTSWKLILVCCFWALGIGDHLGAAQEPVLLWPNNAALNAPEALGKTREDDGQVIVNDVGTPHLIPYLVKDATSPRPAIILCPGGAYNRLVTSVHTPIAAWLNQRGISSFILMYRCPTDRNNGEALPDIQRAIRLVRSRAQEWNIDPHKIGILGSSAGGNLCVRAIGSHDKNSYQPTDDIDQASAKPDFAILLYPAWLAHRAKHTLSTWVTVPQEMGPIIIFAAKDDKHYHSSWVFEKALADAGKSVVGHYFETGGHGFSMPGPEPVSAWPDMLSVWLKDHQLIAK